MKNTIIAGALALAGTAMVSAAPSHADTFDDLSDGQRYVNQLYSVGVPESLVNAISLAHKICHKFDGIASGREMQNNLITDSGLTSTQAYTVVSGAVHNFCPDNAPFINA